MGFGLGISLTSMRRAGGGDPFASLMSTLLSGASQIIAHPLEYGSMFQDRAGTIPVTAPGQLVGMVLDHGFTGSKPMPGPELVTNGTFDTDTDWALGPDTVISGGVLSTTSTIAGVIAQQNLTDFVVGTTYEITYTVLSTNGEVIVPRLSNQSNSSAPATTTTGTFTALVKAVSPIGRIQFNVGGGGLTATIDNISVRELPGYHATAISDAARGVFRDVGGIRYIEYNGVNTAYSTPTLIGVAVDKAQLFAGVRKLSDASLGVIGSLASSVSVTGSLTLDSRRYAAGDYTMTIRNSSANSVQNFVTYSAPITNVLSALYDQSGANIDEELSLRVDGVLSAKGGVSLYNAGSANVASAPIYLGAQSGTSAFFNGRSYATLGPIFRLSAANATTAQIEVVEAYYTARVI